VYKKVITIYDENYKTIFLNYEEYKCPMRKKGQERANLFIPILILAVFIAVGVVVYYLARNTDIPTAGDELRNDMATLNTAIIEELTPEEEQEQIQECNLKASTHQKDWCYLELAKDNRIDVCEMIVQVDFKSYCTAVITTDASECDSIATGSIKDACYISIAQLRLDRSICKKTSRQAYCETLIS
jgi:hypothetical protein